MFPHATAQVRVQPPDALSQQTALFALLSHLFPVTFLPGSDGKAHAHLLLSPESGHPPLPLLQEAPCFLVRPTHPIAAFTPNRLSILTPPPALPHLGSLHFTLHHGLTFSYVHPEPGDQVVATAQDHPFWIESLSPSGHRLTLVGAAPEFPADQQPILALNEDHWLRLLPLLDFLRQVSAPFDWDPSPLRACLMFDDPNLHRPSWGFLDYRSLISHARQHHYHAALATVPLDTWYTHPPTARLFKEFPEYISLLAHGALHTHAELQRPLPSDRRYRDLVHAWRRLQQVESRHGITISRVMAPPHHACSPEACRCLLKAGFTAACVSWKALLRWNGNHPWPPSLGLSMTEWLEDGFPIIPRFNFADQSQVAPLIAAFLRQPIILLGHHWDLNKGMDILATSASQVNRIGPVQWSDMDSILKSCLLTRQSGSHLLVRLHSREVNLMIPPDIDCLQVERPWIQDDQLSPLQLIASSPNLPPLTTQAGSLSPPLPVAPNSKLVLRSPPQPSPPPPVGGRAIVPHATALMRRLMCETRDRSMPWLHHLRLRS